MIKGIAMEVCTVIPIARPVMEKEEKDAVIRVMDSGMLAHGPEVEAFEEEFARYCGTDHAASCSSGTSAIHLSLAALGIKPGDEVITTSFSFIASATPILFQGATPVFVDIDPRTFNMDPDKLKEAITSRTKAIVPVHLYGQCADMDRIMEIAGGIPVLEDCAQSHGSIYKGRIAGSIGFGGMFSFYPTKNMTTGEGGMVVSNDKAFVEKVKMLRNHGQVEQYDHHAVGYNLRMTSIAASIGREQLKKLDHRNGIRRRNASSLSRGLSSVKGITVPFVEDFNDPVFHQYTIKVENDRDLLIEGLNGRGIGNKVFYPSTIPSSPAMKDYGSKRYQVAEEMAKKVLSLPVHPLVTEKDVDEIINAVKEIMG